MTQTIISPGTPYKISIKMLNVLNEEFPALVKTCYGIDGQKKTRHCYVKIADAKLTHILQKYATQNPKEFKPVEANELPKFSNFR